MTWLNSVRKKNRIAHKIIMQLNPFEDDHIKLDIIVRRMNSGQSLKYRNKFRAQAQKVLKREWDVVKKGPMTKRAQQNWSLAWDKQRRKRGAKLRRLTKETSVKTDL